MSEGYGNGRAYASTGLAVGRGGADGAGIGYGGADDPEGTAWVSHGLSLGGFPLAPDKIDAIAGLGAPVMRPA